ncbi:TonB-dependent receptor [Pseudoduganella armeniaca]|uniref:TonB-dependent siderophore receptor n=1 Tax=Pseudoduganella armeniaca TaxID=2072590 RepID=A0A2R4CBY8_9BURK|nr:TonB-dependent siderophore receptor [Pseudoduganella armeniaca]AVR97151.1 TonB-dependent siderophore receptor [Pseudoduganella armeniaca]
MRPQLAPLVLALLTAGAITHAHAEDSAPAEGALPQIVVSAERGDSFAGGQVARKARLGMLGNMDVMSTPFNVSSYTAQAIADQQAVSVADVLTRDPAVRATGQGGGILDAFFIRGFAIGEGNVGEIALDGQYGVAPNYRVFADYAERVEVIKGPAALLYGMSPNSGIGGVVNIVPKRAQTTDLTRLTLDYAGDSQLGAHVDVGRRFGAKREFGVRVNGRRQQGDTQLDKQYRRADVGALALDYQGARLRVTLDALGQTERFDAPSRPFLAAAGVAVPAAPDGKRNVTQDWEWAKIEDRSLLLRTEYDVTDALTVFANAGGARTHVARLFGTPTILNAAGDTRVTPDQFRLDVERATVDGGLRAAFDTGGVQHAVTLQASRYRDQLDRAAVGGRPVLSNLYAPVAALVQDVPAPALVPKVSETHLSGVALADTMTALDERLLVTLGVRRQQVESDNFNASGATTAQYDRRATTPMIGVAFKPWRQLALYANRIEGLSKGDTAPPTAANAGEIFAPYKSRQNEVGVKFERGTLAATLSAFRIEKPSGQLTGNVYAVDGEQRNQGVELAVFGQAMPGLRLTGGATFLDAELTRTNNAATLGKTPVGVPSSQANLGAEWDTALAGLTVTGSVSYTGRQYVNQANTQSIPSWTRLDLGARYQTRIDGRDTTLRASVANVANRDYWSGVASYGAFVQGAPRTLLLSATIDL